MRLVVERPLDGLAQPEDVALNQSDVGEKEVFKLPANTPTTRDH